MAIFARASSKASVARAAKSRRRRGGCWRCNVACSTRPAGRSRPSASATSRAEVEIDQPLAARGWVCEDRKIGGDACRTLGFEFPAHASGSLEFGSRARVRSSSSRSQLSPAVKKRGSIAGSKKLQCDHAAPRRYAGDPADSRCRKIEILDVERRCRRWRAVKPAFTSFAAISSAGTESTVLRSSRAATRRRAELALPLQPGASLAETCRIMPP